MGQIEARESSDEVAGFELTANWYRKALTDAAKTV